MFRSCVFRAEGATLPAALARQERVPFGSLMATTFSSGAQISFDMAAQRASALLATGDRAMSIA